MPARSSSNAFSGKAYGQKHKRQVSATVLLFIKSDSFLGHQRGFKGIGRRQKADRGCGRGLVVAEGSAIEKGRKLLFSTILLRFIPVVKYYPIASEHGHLNDYNC